MSYISQDLVEEVLSRLPVRSILRLRCVSKQWRTTIESPYFIKIHMVKSIKMGSSVEVIHRRSESNFVSLEFDLFGVPIRAPEELGHPFGHRYDYYTDEEDLSFSHRFNSVRPRKNIVNLVGSCNGVLCFVDSTNHIVLWNLATHKYFELPNSEVEYSCIPFNCNHLLKYGFGYDSTMDDYKIIRLKIERSVRFKPVGPFCEFYSLKSVSWKRVDVSLNMNHFNHVFFTRITTHSQYGVFVNGGVHWINEADSSSRIMNYRNESPIVAFDLARDEIISVPCFDLHNRDWHKILGTVNDCLCLFCHHFDTYTKELWVMKGYGVKESWTKIFFETGMNCMDIRPIDHSKSKNTVILEVGKNKLAWYNFEEKKRPITEIDITCTDFSAEACVIHDTLVGTSWKGL